jgi:transposase
MSDWGEGFFSRCVRECVLCVGMARLATMPNRENCTLEELETSSRAASSLRSHVRMRAIRALMLGFSHDQVAKLYSTTRRNLARWVERFNNRGIDGLLDRPRSGRPSKITSEKTAAYVDLIRHPELVDQTHWTGKKFHGYLREALEEEIGYRTVVRWLHEQGFRLKVPRSWPNGQDEEKRRDFVELLRVLFGDPEVDLWFSDETGIEGDPRPRRRWALRGEKILQPYEGSHIRMSATGTVCPRTGEFYALIFSHSDTEIFQIFLDHANSDISFERKRNILILDNASWHRSKKINWGRFEPVFLPPYSPDLNPIERLWLVMKDQWFSDFFAKSQDELINRLCLALNWVVNRKTQNQKTCAIQTKL